MPLFVSSLGRMTTTGWCGLCCLCVVLVASGCSEDDPLGRQAISGKVSLKGQPLVQGQIQFVPEAESGGIFNGAQIHDGTYSLEQQDGLPPGKYRVRINSSEGSAEVDPNQPPGEPTPPTAVERIPADFNSKSTKVIEVTADGDNEFDFEIP
jgi:hypothetical protein